MRVEIVANQSVEEPILQAVEREAGASAYTRIGPVHGRGGRGPRLGTAVWPEENFLLIVYCDSGECERLVRAVAALKLRFAEEGIKVFVSPGEEAV